MCMCNLDVASIPYQLVSDFLSEPQNTLWKAVATQTLDLWLANKLPEAITADFSFVIPSIKNHDHLVT